MTVTLTRQASGSRFVETYYGDTIQRIALRELGDASRWVEIIALNNLRPPYISDTEAAPGVLLSGQLIRIPSATVIARAETDPDLVFGVDVQMAPSGQLQVGAGGDFEVVGGLDNFKQALRNLLATESGELIFHPGYGTKLRRIIGSVAGPTASLLAAAYARDGLANDPRVERIVTSQATVLGDTINVSVKVQPIVGRAVDVTQEL